MSTLTEVVLLVIGLPAFGFGLFDFQRYMERHDYETHREM